MAGAIKAIIATQFDDTGIKKASKQFGDLGKTLKSTLGAVGLTVGLAAITNGLKEASKAAVEDVKSQALLAQQLRNTVGASNEAIAGAEGYIKSLMLQTSIADDQLRPALATLVRSTQDVSQAQSLLALSTDIAAGTGKDLGTVSQAVAKAADGQTTALFRLVPSLKGSADWAKQAGVEFGGMAQAAANNDPFQRMNIVLGELQEQLGGIILPMFNDFANYMASADFSISVSNLMVALQNVAGQLDSLSQQISGKGVFQTILDLAGAAAVGVAEIVFWLSDLGKTASFIFSGQWDKAGNQMATYFTRYNKFVQGIYKEQDKAAAAAKKFTPFTPIVGTTGKSSTGSTYSNGGSSAPKKIPTTALAKTTAELKALSKAMLTSDGDIGKLIDGFDAITKKLDEGLANGALTKKGAKNLKDYVATEKALFVELGKQREELANKRSLAETLIADVKAAIVGVGNLGNLLDDTGNGVVANLRKIVEKTKAFAIQLTTLKSMGLDPALFQQIVDAGAEAGGAIASEIIKGGPASVSELNGLFGELNTVGGQIAEQTAQVMFGAGEDVTNGLINGLMSREQALISAAKTLAASFNAAFNASVITAGITSPAMSSASSSAASSQTNNTINISVKASAGTNTKKVGQDIVNAINTYAKAN